MLPLPENNYTDTQVLASWIELIALADDDGAAFRGALLESMRDSQIDPESSSTLGKDGDSSDPNSAPGKLAEAWAVLRSRQRLLGTAWPFELDQNGLTRRNGRKQLANVAAYTAMLIIEAASLKWYSNAAIQAGDPIRHWFEEIAVAALRRITNGDATRFGAPFSPEWPDSFVDRVRKWHDKGS